LIGVEANFARDRLDDRAAIDAVGKTGETAFFEQLDVTDG